MKKFRKMNCEIKNLNLKLITKYHPNGKKKYEGYYDETDPVGDHTAWHENGNKEYISIDIDKKTEKSIYWHENGKIKSKGFRSTEHYLEIGVWTEWFDNGNKKSEGSYDGEDGRVGEWKFWHIHGQLACSGVFKGYRGNGLWTFLDENGKKIHEREYRENELLDVWKNLRADACSDELIERLKEWIFRG